AFDAQLYSRRKRNTRNNELYWTNYQSLEEIQDWFNHLAEVHRDIVTVVNAGASHEGRNITGIKIARGNPNRAFFLEAGQVAADWLSPTVLTYLVDQLVKGEDPEAMRASEEFEWHIFPIVNPDGFHFSQESVSYTNNHTPSANNYIGIGPFSEVETRQLSRYVDSIGSRLTGFLSFRSFGQRLITIGRRAMGSMAVKYNTQYPVGTSKEVLDGATGSIVDWAKHRYNPPIAATYYLRDEGLWGYTLPVNQITPTCEETYDSLLAILREARFINVI
ncbi:putative carboxypeptidase A-like protein, partial [Operophtera brumata]